MLSLNQSIIRTNKSIMVPDCVTIMQTKTTMKVIVITNMRSIQWFPNTVGVFV